MVRRKIMSFVYQKFVSDRILDFLKNKSDIIKVLMQEKLIAVAYTLRTY